MQKDLTKVKIFQKSIFFLGGGLLFLLCANCNHKFGTMTDSQYIDLTIKQ